MGKGQVVLVCKVMALAVAAGRGALRRLWGRRFSMLRARIIYLGEAHGPLEGVVWVAPLWHMAFLLFSFELTCCCYWTQEDMLVAWIAFIWWGLTKQIHLQCEPLIRRGPVLLGLSLVTHIFPVLTWWGHLFLFSSLCLKIVVFPVNRKKKKKASPSGIRILCGFISGKK